MNQPDLSIVIPAYCEERRIGKTLEDLAKYLKQDEFLGRKLVEVMVVAADAPDRTHEIIASKQRLFRLNHVIFTLLKPGQRVGKGRDVMYGILHARGKYIMFMDADLATPLHHVKEFFETCENGSDVVIGTRDLFRYRSSKVRNLFSIVGNRLYQLTTGISIKDTHCGFKMFTYEAAQLCFARLTILGWGFDLEVLAIAKANGLTILPIRIDDWEDKPYSTYQDNILQITLSTVGDLGKVKARQLTGRYI
jgi:dolichyl-phosphate beta-glucosyltransferase